MGGDKLVSRHSSTDDDESWIEQDLTEQSVDALSTLNSEEVSSHKVENGSADEFGDAECRRSSSTSLAFNISRRRFQRVYVEVLATYDDSQPRFKNLEEAKNRILSYTPGSWIENIGGFKIQDYHVPETISILLIGPKGSGKSSLVNKISRFFEKDKFASERAQVSNNSSFGEGTYFLQEYMIPRGSRSFCLYDTRSLSDSSIENTKILNWWLTKGVRHGELVRRASDGANLKHVFQLKARQNGQLRGKIRVVNFVVMVVNGIEVLESLDGNEEGKKQYTQMIATTFNTPFLSFKDDKPVIVVTHGDLLTLTDRVRIRIYLGDLLGVPPKTQIFDIPESHDQATELAIVDLLNHCLEHADRNLPLKSRFMSKIDMIPLSAYLLLMVVLGVGYIFYFIQVTIVQSHHQGPAPSDVHIDWHAIRHLWLD